MATNDSSNPSGQFALELVEILKRLGAHRRAVHEQTYGNPPWTREQSDAYWYHPLVRACEWLEQRVGISRHDLEDAAFRLTTPLGLQGMDPLTGPGGRTTDPGQKDWLWMIPKFRELDRDGTTASLWQLLADEYPAILEEAAAPKAAGGGEESGNAGGVPDSPSGFLGGADLADALGVHPSRRAAFFQQLLRKRMSLGDDCWHEVTERRPNSPCFLYRADSPTLRRLAASYKTPKPA